MFHGIAGDYFGSRRFLHGADEAKALPRQCFDQALLVAGIADRVSRDIQAGRQRLVGNDAPAPDGTDEFVLTDYALSVADQKFQQIEDLRAMETGALPRYISRR